MDALLWSGATRRYGQLYCGGIHGRYCLPNSGSPSRCGCDEHTFLREIRAKSASAWRAPRQLQSGSRTFLPHGIYVRAVGTFWNQTGVDEEHAMRKHSWLEFLVGRCVHHNRNGRASHYWGGNISRGYHHSTIGRTASLLRTIGGHPCDLQTCAHGRIGQYLTHDHDSLATKTGHDRFHPLTEHQSLLSSSSSLSLRLLSTETQRPPRRPNGWSLFVERPCSSSVG